MFLVFIRRQLYFVALFVLAFHFRVEAHFYDLDTKTSFDIIEGLHIIKDQISYYEKQVRSTKHKVSSRAYILGELVSGNLNFCFSGSSSDIIDRLKKSSIPSLKIEKVYVQGADNEPNLVVALLKKIALKRKFLLMSSIARGE